MYEKANRFFGIPQNDKFMFIVILNEMKNLMN
jgi:hypothetical protein